MNDVAIVVIISTPIQSRDGSPHIRKSVTVVIWRDGMNDVAIVVIVSTPIQSRDGSNFVPLLEEAEAIKSWEGEGSTTVVYSVVWRTSVV
jgi:hypothetical protein